MVYIHWRTIYMKCVLTIWVWDFEEMLVSPQIILMTLESSKISVLLGALDLNPKVGQKTLIITNFAQEVEDVFKVNWQLLFPWTTDKNPNLKTKTLSERSFHFVHKKPNLWLGDIKQSLQNTLKRVDKTIRTLYFPQCCCCVATGSPCTILHCNHFQI